MVSKGIEYVVGIHKERFRVIGGGWSVVTREEFQHVQRRLAEVEAKQKIIVKQLKNVVDSLEEYDELMWCHKCDRLMDSVAGCDDGLCPCGMDKAD